MWVLLLVPLGCVHAPAPRAAPGCCESLDGVPEATPPPVVAPARGTSISDGSALIVHFEGSPSPAAVEVACGSVFRQRAAVVHGSVTMKGVPAGLACQLYPKGLVATSAPVGPGRAYTCVFVGTTMSCR